MRILLPLVVILAAAAQGCAYRPTPPDPIRVVSSPADVVTCRRLGRLGVTRTDGVAIDGPAEMLDLPPAIAPGDPATRMGPPGPNFGVRLNLMEEEALRRGATDVLLRRRYLRDWSYVEAVAYRCRR